MEELTKLKHRHDYQFWKRIHKILVSEYISENKNDPWFEYNPIEFTNWVVDRYGFMISKDENGLMTSEYFLIDQKKFSLFNIKFS